MRRSHSVVVRFVDKSSRFDETNSLHLDQIQEVSISGNDSSQGLAFALDDELVMRNDTQSHTVENLTELLPHLDCRNYNAGELLFRSKRSNPADEFRIRTRS